MFISLYPNVLKIIKGRRMRWVENVARMWRRGMRVRYWWEGQKERDH
jgi:hypothetical protein